MATIDKDEHSNLFQQSAGHNHKPYSKNRAKANVHLRDDNGETALHFGAKNGFGDVCRLLLAFGAKVDEVNFQKKTALHLAAKAGRSDVVQALIEGGAHVEAEDADGSTPFDLMREGEKLAGRNNAFHDEFAVNNTDRGGNRVSYQAVMHMLS